MILPLRQSRSWSSKRQHQQPQQHQPPRNTPWIGEHVAQQKQEQKMQPQLGAQAQSEAVKPRTQTPSGNARACTTINKTSNANIAATGANTTNNAAKPFLLERQLCVVPVTSAHTKATAASLSKAAGVAAPVIGAAHDAKIYHQLALCTSDASANTPGADFSSASSSLSSDIQDLPSARSNVTHSHRPSHSQSAARSSLLRSQSNHYKLTKAQHKGATNDLADAPPTVGNDTALASAASGGGTAMATAASHVALKVVKTTPTERSSVCGSSFSRTNSKKGNSNTITGSDGCDSYSCSYSNSDYDSRSESRASADNTKNE